MSQKRSLFLAFIPVIVLVVLMVINVIVFKDEATSGPNQWALIIAAFTSALIGHYFHQTSYERIEKGILKSLNMAIPSCLILLLIGSVIGSWIVSGVVPTLIYYGFKIIHPMAFLPLACLTCAIVSLSTGSSWTTSGTIGIALMAIGKTYGVPLPMVAGAIISGSYFGDKMSPLSDTTNLAPAIVGTNLFTHIRHMIYTSGPAILLALVGFIFLGLFVKTDLLAVEFGGVQGVSGVLEKHFFIHPVLLLVPISVFVMVGKKVPAIAALIGGTFFALIFAVIFQKELLTHMIGGEWGVLGLYKQLIHVLAKGPQFDYGDTMINSLLNRGGMGEMLSTIWLIICAMVFGGVMESTGMLAQIASLLLRFVKGTGSLVGATLASCIFTNATASDQYVAIVVPGKMFRAAYEKYGLHPKNLSRALEDAGTVTSVLIPWNSGGAYHAQVLNVPTIEYLPFCFFNLLSPVVSLFLASMEWKMTELFIQFEAQKLEGEA